MDEVDFSGWYFDERTGNSIARVDPVKKNGFGIIHQYRRDRKHRYHKHDYTVNGDAAELLTGKFPSPHMSVRGLIEVEGERKKITWLVKDKKSYEFTQILLGDEVGCNMQDIGLREVRSDMKDAGVIKFRVAGFDDRSRRVSIVNRTSGEMLKIDDVTPDLLYRVTDDLLQERRDKLKKETDDLFQSGRRHLVRGHLKEELRSGFLKDDDEVVKEIKKKNQEAALRQNCDIVKLEIDLAKDAAEVKKQLDNFRNFNNQMGKEADVDVVSHGQKRLAYVQQTEKDINNAMKEGSAALAHTLFKYAKNDSNLSIVKEATRVLEDLKEEEATKQKVKPTEPIQILMDL